MRRRPNQTKAVCQIRHAQKRALERYGFHPDPSSLRYIVNQIQAGNGTLVFKQSRRVSIWDVVSLSEVPCRVVYDCSRKTIVSFLPIEENPEIPLEELFAE